MPGKKTTQGYVTVNGLNMYYEVHGDGQPLVLLHGAFSATGTSFGKLIPLLAKERKVISFELQAHGRTADIDRPLSVEAMADDTAAAIKELGLGASHVSIMERVELLAPMIHSFLNLPMPQDSA